MVPVVRALAETRPPRWAGGPDRAYLHVVESRLERGTVGWPLGRGTVGPRPGREKVVELLRGGTAAGWAGAAQRPRSMSRLRSGRERRPCADSFPGSTQPAGLG